MMVTELAEVTPAGRALAGHFLARGGGRYVAGYAMGCFLDRSPKPRPEFLEHGILLVEEVLRRHGDAAAAALAAAELGRIADIVGREGGSCCLPDDPVAAPVLGDYRQVYARDRGVVFAAKDLYTEVERAFNEWYERGGRGDPSRR